MGILQHIIKSFDNVYILLDALDECDEREDLCDCIAEIIGWKIGTLHLLATSRREKDIEDCLLPLLTCQLCIHSELVADDIRTHVLERLSHDIKLKARPPMSRKGLKTHW